jgi:hypothetical protein
MTKNDDIAAQAHAMRGKSPEQKWKVDRPRLLQRSLDEFREAYSRRAEIGERAAYVEAIRALTGVLLYLEDPLNLSDEDPAFMWFVDLQIHLEDLDSGIVPPMLDCDVRSKGLSTVEWKNRLWAVLDIETLHAAGMKYKDAAIYAIRGQKLLEVSEKEVLSWCAEFRKGRVKNREAVALYKDARAWLQRNEGDAEELQQAVARLFHEWGLPTPNSQNIGE